jgi:polyhydroxybutyrate depolymerase
MLIHADEDQVVHFTGKAGAYQSAMATYNYWKRLNGLEGFPGKCKEINRSNKDSSSVQVPETKGAGRTVTLVPVKGGGHTWPGSHPFNIGFSPGNTSSEIDANDLIWKFFANHNNKEK